MKKFVSDEQALAIIKGRINAIPNPVSADDEILVRKLYSAMSKAEQSPRDWWTILRNVSLSMGGLAFTVSQFIKGLLG